MFEDQPRSIQCRSCQPKYESGFLPNEQRTACEKPPWKVPSDCSENEQYLDDTSTDFKNWTCVPCIYGADCSGHQTIQTLKALPSYRTMTWSNDVFGKCSSPDTCNIKYTNNSGCRHGHNANTSELCAQCIVGWAATTRTEVCARCPARGWTILLFCMAVLFVVGLFTYLVADSIDGAKEMIETKESMPFHSISIRIVSSYLQVAGMLLSFDLTLPASVRGLIMVEASTSSLSEQFLHFDCLTDLRSDGEMFVIKQLTSVWIIPFVSVLFCGFFWCIRNR